MPEPALSRRGLFRAAAGGTVAAAAGGALAATPAEAARRGPIRPPALQAGDIVRIVAPGYPGDARLARGVEIFEELGYVVQIAPHVYDQFGYLAGSDANRLADLNDAINDPDVRCVWAARGGYGTQRITDGVDVRAARRDPKIYLGFSDLTALFGRLWQEAGLVTFFGPLATWADARTGPDSIASLHSALTSTDDIVLTVDPAEPSAAVNIKGNATGRAQGPLLGGTLTLLQHAIDTDDLPDLRGAILLFEDTGEAPYSYDRMLTHLLRSGALKGLAGVAIGQFHLATGTTWSAAQAVTDRLQDLGVPVLGGFRIGHGNGQLTVPLGSEATVDTGTGTLVVRAGVTPASS